MGKVCQTYSNFALIILNLRKSCFYLSPITPLIVGPLAFTLTTVTAIMSPEQEGWYSREGMYRLGIRLCFMQHRQVTENAILSFRSDPWQPSILLKIINLMITAAWNTYLRWNNWVSYACFLLHKKTKQMTSPPRNAHSLGGASHTSLLRRRVFFFFDSRVEHVWRLSSQQRSTVKKTKKHFIYTRKQDQDNSHLFTGTDGVTFGAPLARLQDPRTVTCHTYDASNTNAQEWVAALFNSLLDCVYLSLSLCTTT